MKNEIVKNQDLITKEGLDIQDVINKERESSDYDPSNIMTFKEAPLFPKMKEDLMAHLLCDQQNTKDFYFTNMYGYLSVAHQHDKSDHIIHNKLLKFSKPSGGVKIAQRMLDTLFPANIVSRYKLYDEKGFNEKTLMHYMSVPIFYHSKKAVFSVQLPDGFMKNIGSKLINIPKFEYETEKELLAKYKIDLNNFAKKYYQLFIDFQKSIKVILIECKSQKEVNLESLLSNDFNSIIKFNSHNIQSMLSFATSINITKGQLYGDVFFQTNDDETINVNNSIALSSYRKRKDDKYFKTESDKIFLCLEYTEEQWDNLKNIVETFRKAQIMLENLFKESIGEENSLDKPIKNSPFLIEKKS